MDEQEAYLAQYNVHDFDVPLTTVDVVTLALFDERLHVQLVHRENHPFKNHWALPGGFINVNQDQSLEETAHRILRTKTGVEAPYVEQIGGFGNAGRDPRGWSTTFVYLALLNPDELEGEFLGRWQPVADVIDELAFDHNQLLDVAMERLRSKVSYSSLPLHLLPGQFTLRQCQRVFEIVLGHPLEKSAFRRRLRDADIVEAIPNAFERGSNRPAALYRLKQGRETVFFPGVLRGKARVSE